MARQFKGMAMWKLLCRKPYLSVADMMQELGWRREGVRAVIQWLRIEGCIKRHGNSTATKWTATETIPVDGRGMAAGTHAVLRRSATPESIAHAQRIRLEMVERGEYHVRNRRPKRLPKRESALAGAPLLEQLWPSAIGLAKAIQPVAYADNDRKPSHQRAQPLETAENEEEAA